jgi:hypothetical protein
VIDVEERYLYGLCRFSTKTEYVENANEKKRPIQNITMLDGLNSKLASKAITIFRASEDRQIYENKNISGEF